mgnify:CR=1 FL=1
MPDKDNNKTSQKIIGNGNYQFSNKPTVYQNINGDNNFQFIEEKYYYAKPPFDKEKVISNLDNATKGLTTNYLRLNDSISILFMMTFIITGLITYFFKVGALLITMPIAVVIYHMLKIYFERERRELLRERDLAQQAYNELTSDEMRCK